MQSAAVVGAVASRDADLDRALTSSASTARTLAGERATLASVLRRAPATLADATATLREVDTTFRRLTPTARRLGGVAPDAAALLTDLQPLLRRSGPALASVRRLLPDLGAVLRGAPALRGAALPAFAATSKAVDELLPIVAGARPYLPDLFHGVVSGFGATAVNSYDANGHYARVAPVSSQLSPTGGAAALAGTLPGARKGLTRRCPGGAYRTVPGERNNTVREGSTACDPGQAP